jgi:hypothetical protein
MHSVLTDNPTYAFTEMVSPCPENFIKIRPDV